MPPRVCPHNEAIPNYFCRLHFVDVMRGKFIDIVLDVPFGRIESVPVDQG